MIKKISLLLFSFCFIFLSCRKELGRGPIAYIPQEVKTFFNYKPGSYWVYQDSISGDYDSVECQEVIVDTLMFTYHDWKNDGKLKVESYELMQLNNIIYHPDNSYTPYNGINISSKSDRAVDGVFQIKREDFYGQSWYLIYPFTVGNHFINDQADTVVISALLDHYSINSMTFDSVLVSDVLLKHNNSERNMRYYSVKGIGIIQIKSRYDTTNYKLVSYHIEY